MCRTSPALSLLHSAAARVPALVRRRSCSSLFAALRMQPPGRCLATLQVAGLRAAGRFRQLRCSHPTFSKFPDLHVCMVGNPQFPLLPSSAARRSAHDRAYDRLPSCLSPSPKANFSFRRRLNSLTSFGT